MSVVTDYKGSIAIIGLSAIAIVSLFKGADTGIITQCITVIGVIAGASIGVAIGYALGRMAKS